MTGIAAVSVSVCAFHTSLIVKQCVSTGEQQAELGICPEMGMLLQQCLYAWLHSVDVSNHRIKQEHADIPQT